MLCHNRPVRATYAAAIAAASVSLLAGCGGSGANKAGGSETRQPLVLTLESEDDLSLTGAPEFAAAVKRVSGGSMRIVQRHGGRETDVNYERDLVQDVARGKAQLGIVGVRVWDTMGVRSFQALLAPFLISTLALERRALDSPLATDMLRGVSRAGLVGIAVLPGPLRRPLGLPRALARPGNYEGATIGSRPAGVARATLRALGATPLAYVPGSLTGLDGIEVDTTTIAYNGWDQQEGALTTNVVLWPKPYSIVMNRKAFELLTGEQQELLRRAGREAGVPELRQVESDAAAALTEACKLGRLTFVTASPSQLAKLRQAVQPVYARLERDSQTRRWLEALETMRKEEPAAIPLRSCHGASARRPRTQAAALEGRWRMNWTRAELIASGIPARYLTHVPRAGSVTYEFADGRFRTMIDKGPVFARGTYVVDGGVLQLVYAAPAPAGHVAGHLLRQRWSIYRGSLTFSRFPGSDFDAVLLVKPLTRVR
jgi:TRAP-type C4-dicarboxylate transport system substrate-binding protein